MPQPRKYKTNADRQAAYRKRKATLEHGSPSPTKQMSGIVSRVMAADRAESATR